MGTDCNKTHCVEVVCGRGGGLWEGYRDSDRPVCHSSSSCTHGILSSDCIQHRFSVDDIGKLLILGCSNTTVLGICLSVCL